MRIPVIYNTNHFRWWDYYNFGERVVDIWEIEAVHNIGLQGSKISGIVCWDIIDRFEENVRKFEIQ